MRRMERVRSVDVADDHHSHWTVQGPTDTPVEWDAEVTDDTPGRRIAWRTTENAYIDHSGSVEFLAATGQRGTIVKVVMEYNTPVGMAGAAVAKLLGREPGQQVQTDLRRFKQLMEAGEILRSDGSLRGIGFTEQRPARPARTSIDS